MVDWKGELVKVESNMHDIKTSFLKYKEKQNKNHHHDQMISLYKIITCPIIFYVCVQVFHLVYA
jgi:hypothetical protein